MRAFVWALLSALVVAANVVGVRGFEAFDHRRMPGAERCCVDLDASREHMSALRQRVRDMFWHGFNGYLTHGSSGWRRLATTPWAHSALASVSPR